MHLRSLLVPLFSALLAAPLALGCSGTDGAADPAPLEEVGATSDALSASYYDGEALYRGLFFRSGAVAKALPELWTLIGQQPVPSKDVALERLRAAATALEAAGKPSLARATKTLAEVNAKLPTTSLQMNTPPELADVLISSIKAANPTFFARFAKEVQSGSVLRVEKIMLEASQLSADAVATFVNGSPGALSAQHTPYWYTSAPFLLWNVGVYYYSFVVLVNPMLKTSEGTLLHNQLIKLLADRLYYVAPLTTTTALR